MSKKTQFTEDQDDNMLPPADEPAAMPDEWYELAPKEDHTKAHQELEDLTAAFLAQGGAITQVESGVRRDTVTPFNREYVNYGATAIYSHSQFKTHVSETQRKANEAREARDATVAKRLAELLPLKLGKGELLHHVGCSEGVLQRVIDNHFAGDERALAYKKLTWGERDRQLVEKFKELRETYAFTVAAEKLHVKPDRLKKLLVKHGVRI